MSAEDGGPWLSILAVVGIVGVLTILWVVWMRERVKKALHRKGLSPIRVRWRPLAYWAPVRGTAFKVIYADEMGSARTARCWVSKFDFGVRWIEDGVGYLEKDLPLVGRIVYTLISAFLIQFGVRVVLAAELFFPPTLSHPRGVHLYGWSKNLLCYAAFCGAVSLLSHVVYHYRSAANERSYRLFARSFSVIGWILLWSSLVVYAYQLSTR